MKIEKRKRVKKRGKNELRNGDRKGKSPLSLPPSTQPNPPLPTPSSCSHSSLVFFYIDINFYIILPFIEIIILINYYYY